MLWFALFLPSLPLDAWLTGAELETIKAKNDSEHQPTLEPRVILDQRRVVCVDALGESLGLQSGMTLAAASSLAPSLQSLVRDPLREAALIERLALSLSRFTPSLVSQSDGVLMEVAASLRLFGGVRGLTHRLREVIEALGLQANNRHCRLARAPTATAAALLARASSSASRTSPSSKADQRAASFKTRLDRLALGDVLNGLPSTRDLGELLEGIGCRTLGDVRALPRTGLKRRGAQALIDVIDRAYGDAPDPQPWWTPPPRFEQSLELMHRADNAEALLFAAQRLVEPLSGWLAQRWLAAARITQWLKHESLRRREEPLPDTAVVVELGEPSRDPKQIALLLRERLQRVALPAPVYALRLVLDEAPAHAGRESAFWTSAKEREQSEQALIDRLSARLGADQVLRPVLQHDHRPEFAQHWEPAQSFASKQTRAGNAQHVSPHSPRPTWLLNQPQPLAMQDNRPVLNGEPLLVVSRAERIEAGWFDGADQLVERDYRIAVDAEHRCYWIFQAGTRWYLHGLFA